MRAETKDKVRGFFARAKQAAVAGARTTKLKARSLGRRASSAASRERRAFCARTAGPRTDDQVIELVNRALRVAYGGLGRDAQQIADSGSALRISLVLRQTAGKDNAATVARLAGLAAAEVRKAMETRSSAAWNRAAEYADDALDRGTT